MPGRHQCVLLGQPHEKSHTDTVTPQLVFHYLWHRITWDWDLSVWIQFQHWYLILLVVHNVIMYNISFQIPWIAGWAVIRGWRQRGWASHPRWSTTPCHRLWTRPRTSNPTSTPSRWAPPPPTSPTARVWCPCRRSRPRAPSPCTRPGFTPPPPPRPLPPWRPWGRRGRRPPRPTWIWRTPHLTSNTSVRFVATGRRESTMAFTGREIFFICMVH